jgi:hypothetical protein
LMPLTFQVAIRTGAERGIALRVPFRLGSSLRASQSRPKASIL